MRITHVTDSSPQITYDIESDRFGSYTIRSEGRVIKRVTSLRTYIDKPRWGSKKLELRAIDDAKAAIAAFKVP
jgi:hypothetical protein